MGHAPCTLCAAPARRRLRVGSHAIHRCGRCDFEFVHPLPRAEDIAAVYASGYFSGGGAGYRDYFGAEHADAERKARERLARLHALGARQGGALLDVGCADGTFLREALARGFRVRGVEVSPEARARLPSELEGLVGSALDEAAAQGPYDVATLWDVLEHLPDPLGALRTLRAALAPGALIAIVVPVIDNANARVLPRTWDQYKPPEHLWYFSRRALRTTLERELGARLLAEEPAWRREARWLDVARPASSPLGRALRRAERALWRSLVATRVIDPARLEDSVLFIARTPGGPD